ncbi:MAG: ATP-binding protein [Candidatus Cloacimonetes bacterium]|nr:ATP-binding protein [Candidatus Cloacimonadota bacterium]
MEFIWHQLKNGFRGFEKLAFHYVKEKFPNLTNLWERTPETRDKNRDAYTIVLGFKPYWAKEEQWWMEAKFSNEKKILTRYRLDATIVSAILTGNVSKVIFITNIQVAAKTVMDIRQALKRAVNCSDVTFCSKNTLELWLHNNSKILKEYFHNFEEYKYVPPDLLVTEEVDFYAQISQHMAFKEPLNSLYPNRYYTGHFTVFSSKSNILDFIPSNKQKNIIDYSPKSFTLMPGDNQLEFSFKFTQQAQITNWYPNFMLGSCPVLPKKHVEISSNLNTDIEIQYQKYIFNDFQVKFNLFQKTLSPTIYCIIGGSGIGKTYLLNKIVDNIGTICNIFFYQEFSDSIIYNNIALVEMILFILFPFISPKDIDLEYLESIKNDNYISEAIKNIVNYKNSLEEMGKILHSFSNEEDIFPVSISISPRFIILDDVQKLNYAEKSFLIKLINNIKLKKIPIFFLLSGQPHFFTEDYTVYKKRWSIYENKCEINKNDVIKYLEENISINKNFDLSSFDTSFKTVIELFIFAKHLDNIGKEINSLKELLFACRQFYSDKIYEQYLLDKFYKIDKHYPEISEFINAIYWAENGISCNYSDLHTIDKYNLLIKDGLVELRDEMIYPSHDLYTHIYRENYEPILENKYLQIDKFQALRFSLFFRNKPVDWNELIDTITRLKQEQKHHTIMYILEDIFENMDLAIVCQWMGKEVFYTIFMTYAQVSTNLSTTRSGRSLFEKIRNETKDYTNQLLLNINKTATWELLNSSYEWLEYENAKYLIDELLKLVTHLQQYGVHDTDILKCISYHDAMVIQTLIDSDMRLDGIHDEFLFRYKQMQKNNFDYRSKSFRVRYSLTLLQSDPDLAIDLLQKSMVSISKNYSEDDKFYFWSGMCYYFMQMVYKKNLSNIDQVIILHEKMKKNFYNDYRKKTLALANFFYSQNELGTGNKYLFSDVHVERGLRPRQEGFYYATIALHESISGKYNEAVNSLTASSKIFSHIPSYLKIINHNLSLLKAEKFDNKRIEFCCGDQMEKNTFYIDPRCIW